LLRSLAKKMAKTKKPSFIFAVGRRKESTARVRLYRGKAENTVNGIAAAVYFPGELSAKVIAKPFGATESSDKYYFSAKVVGGGKEGQLAAVALGVARALVKIAPDKNRTLLKKLGLLSRDARIRQRRMVGKGGKARRKKQSPKR
jgi:small subunit ribosomal protein S9